jgi:alpha-tubulin suppressor-like RCC1 family protein
MMRSESVPKKILDKVASVSAGFDFCLAIRLDGTLWGWGNNNGGQLMNSDYDTVVTTPKQLASGMKIPNGVTLSAAPTKSTVLVNGTATAFDAYNINGSNYFMLRDLAYVLNGTQKQFEVGWDALNNAISLTSGTPYTSTGSEMAVWGGTEARDALPTTSMVFLDGRQISVTAYRIGSNNFFKLREIAALIDFGVGWDAPTATITIDTSVGYTAP